MKLKRKYFTLKEFGYKGWNISINGRAIGSIDPVNSRFAQPDQRYAVATLYLINGTRHTYHASIRDALVYLINAYA